MLRDLNLKAVYNSEEDNILQDFYIPALQNSTSYERAVGYFDAKMLTSAAAGLTSFIQNSGYMRLICGSTLTEEEYVAITQGYTSRSIVDRVEENFVEIIAKAVDPLQQHQLQVLTWLIQNKKLDVKIALRRRGIHHQKIGIFKDSSGDSLIFQGSANETNNALLPYNYETINVFKSWHPELEDHYRPHVESFSKLWRNAANNTLVLDISEITLKVLSNKYPDVVRPTIENEIALWQSHFNFEPDSNFNGTPLIPSRIGGKPFKLHDHQKGALEKWQNNKYKGVFELATGSGKTITAIYGAVKMYETRGKLFLVIAVPYQNLADQWAENLSLFKIRPIICYGGEGNWKVELSKSTLDFKAGLIDFCAAIVVNATMTSSKRTFVDIMALVDADLSDHFMFVGDECHHHGAYSTFKSLPTTANLRMGLSATPDRGGEDQGNQYIQDYYGDVIARYTLEDALTDKVLTPYEYYLIPVSLTLDETGQYIFLSRKIARLYAMMQSIRAPSKRNEDGLNVLLLKRSRILNGSVNKPKALEELLDKLTPIRHSLFYCAEGKLDDGEGVDEESALKQIQIVSQILHERGWKSCQFTANENKVRRNIILEDFKNGAVDSLVAMKCLDEGVDIPLCTTAFIMSSSRKERQFIQRRGRILRKSSSKEKALIYDFVITLPLGDMNDATLGRKLMISELQRINEFAALSLNKSAAYQSIDVYLREYDLYHHVT